MLKVFCIGDSLALPGHLNKYEDTWYYKLKKYCPEYDFNSFFKRQLTTDVLVTMGGGERGIDKWPKGADCFEAYMPDIVIIQLGIVDCAPRLMNTFDRAVMKIIPDLLKKTYIQLIKFFRKRRIENTIVPIEQFKKNLITYLNRTNKSKSRVIFISISVPNSSFLVKNPDIIINVNKYNKILYQLAEEYDNVLITPVLNEDVYGNTIYEDGYHPNQFGHDIIFNHLLILLK